MDDRKMNNRFFVSICVPVYNTGAFLGQTLESLVRQTYPDREIVISNNHSTDNTLEVIRKYQEKYPIRYCETPEVYTVGEGNFNRCVELTPNADAVCIFHADDLYDPDIVSRQADILRQNERVGAVFALAEVINEEGRPISRYRLPPELKKLNRQVYSFDEIFSCILKYENSFLICPSPMVRRKVYDEMGAWEYDKYKSASDLGLWFKIAQKYDIAIIDEPLVKYRISRQQGSFLVVRQRTGEADYFRLMDSFKEKIKDHPNAKYYIVSKIKDRVFRALNLSAAGTPKQSQGLVREALQIYRREFFKIVTVPRAHIGALIAICLFVLNGLPGKARVSFRTFILKLAGLKKAIFSY